MDASIVIASLNRCEDVVRAVESAYAQEGVELEVLVYDDGSEDGTAEVLRKRFPDLRIFVNVRRTGYIVSRNRGFQDARADFVFSLDDDAYFSSTDTVARTLECFVSDESIAAVAIPFVEPARKLSRSSRDTPFVASPMARLRNYVGCAHAVRRSTVLELGGYREIFVHQGEERDLGLRLIDRGWKIVFGDSAPIVHTISPKRESGRIYYFATRNIILFSALNLPMSAALLRMLWDPWAILRYRFSWNTLGFKLRGALAGYVSAVRYLKLRCPVSPRSYQLFRQLPAHGPLPESAHSVPNAGAD